MKSIMNLPNDKPSSAKKARRLALPAGPSGKSRVVFVKNDITPEFPIYAAFIGIVLSIIMYTVIKGWENDLIEESFHSLAGNHSLAIQDELDHHIKESKIVGALLMDLDTVDSPQVAAFMSIFLKENQHIDKVYWVPARNLDATPGIMGKQNINSVNDHRLAKVDLAASAWENHYPGISVFDEKGASIFVPGGYLLPPEIRDVRLGMEWVNGSDMPLNGSSKVTNIFSKYSINETSAENNESSGFLFISLDVKAIFKRTLELFKGLEVDIHIYENGDNGSVIPVVSLINGRLVSTPSLDKLRDLKGDVGAKHQTEIKMKDKRLVVIQTPTDNFINQRKGWMPVISLVTLLLLTTSVAGVVTHYRRERLLDKYEEDQESVVRNMQEVLRSYNSARIQLGKTSRVLHMMEKCSQVLRTAEFEGDLTHDICRSIVEYGGYKLAWLGFVRYDENKSVDVTSKAGYDEGYVKNLNISWDDNEWGRGPSGTAIRTGRPSVCNDVSSETSFAPWKENALERGYLSAASFPLSYNDRIIGVISVYSTKKDMFDDWEVSNLEKLAGSVSFGIKTIRERKTGEFNAKAQKDVMNLFRASFENANIGIALTNREGRFIMTNKSFCEMLGYKSDELTNRSFMDVSHPEEIEMAKGMMGEMSEGKKDFDRVEKRYIRKDGSTIWGIANISVVRAAGGKPLMYIAQIQDITARKMMEEQLRKNEKRYETLLRLSPVGIFKAGADGKFIFVNKRWLEITGLPQEEAMGDGWEKSLHPEDAQRVKNSWMEFVDGGAEFRTEFRFRDKHGRIVWVYGQSEPELNEAGEVSAFTGAITDITEKKNSERHAKMIERKLAHTDKMMSLGTMVAGMAHEVNNPNNFIMVNAPQLERMWKSVTPILERYYKENGDFALGGIPYSRGRERAPRLISGIMRGSQRIAAISEKLTRYSRNSQQSMEIISINDVVASAIELVQMLIDSSTYKFHKCFMQEKALINGRSLELEQVVVNLLTNACLALPGKTNPIFISTVFNKDINCMEVEVKDHGVGVSPENLPRIMEPFFSTRQDSGGTGLGLFISYNIIREHNGDLEFSSEPGKWTRAIIRIPAYKE